MIYLCRRGRENLRQMSRNTFEVKTDGSGRKYVMQVLDESNKNHSATDNRNDTIGEGRMYERIHDTMCPVQSFLKYVTKLNPDNDAFWQTPCNTFTLEESIWYTRSPLGKNTLSAMMSNISKLAKLSVLYTNHCIRTTSITELDEAGIESRHIMRVSGHKSETSLKHYSSRLSEKKKREISDCLGDTLSKLTSATVSQTAEHNFIQTASLEDLDLLSSDVDNLLNDDFQLENVNVGVHVPSVQPVVNENCLQNTTDHIVQSDSVTDTSSNTGSVLLPGSDAQQNTVSDGVQRNSITNMNNFVSNTCAPQMFIRNMPNINNNNCNVNFHFHFH